MNQRGCLSDDELKQLIVADEEWEDASATIHLDECGTCQKRFEELSSSQWNLDVSGENESYRRLAKRMVHVARVDTFSVESTDSHARTSQSPPEQLDHFTITRLLGQGGMGRVYEAWDTKLNRRVAVKQMHIDVAGDAVLRERVLTEARSAAAVSHPNIVSPFSVHDATDPPFFVMEFIDGPTLAELLIWNDSFNAAEIVQWLEQVADALHAAHAQGIVHCDVKPANIILSKDRQICRVCDFGIARATSNALDDDFLPILGTPNYMSPEQCRGRSISSASDMFSLGVVAYQMMTKSLPFVGSTLEELRQAICESKPDSIRKRRSDLPIWLIQLTDKLLEKDARLRPTADEALKILRNEENEQPASRRTRHFPKYIAASVAVVVLALSMMTWMFFEVQRVKRETLSRTEAIANQKESPRDFVLTQRLLAQKQLSTTMPPGTVVTWDGDWAAIGVTSAFTSAAQSGKVFLLKYNIDETGRGTWLDHSSLSPNSMLPIQFGSSIAMKDGILAVGAINEHDPIPKAGTVYVYERNSDSWDFACKIRIPKVVKEAQFGASIAIKNGKIVIGSPEDGSTYGHAYVFRRLAGKWELEQTITPPESSGLRRFGCQVCFAGEELLIADEMDSRSPDNSGVVHTYRQHDGRWTLVQSFSADTDEPTRWFGKSLTYHDGRLFVLAYHEQEDFGKIEVRLFVFQSIGGKWTCAQKLTTPLVLDRSDLQQEFRPAGVCVSASDKYVGIGFRLDKASNYQQSSCFLEMKDGKWTLTDSNHSHWGAATTTLAVGDSRMLIGSYERESKDVIASSIIALQENEDKTWGQIQEWRPPSQLAGNPRPHDRFGQVMGAANDRVFLAARGRFVRPGQTKGAVYVLKKQNDVPTSWELETTITSPQSNVEKDDGSIGYSLAASRNQLATVEWRTSEPGMRQLAMHIFRRDTESWRLQRTFSDLPPVPKFARFSMAMNRDSIALGIYDRSRSGRETYLPGQVRLFAYDDSKWNSVQNIPSPTTSENDQFGCSVALLDDLLLVGAKAGFEEWDGGPGIAYLYEYIKKRWRLKQQLVGTKRSNGDRFGDGVAISPDWIAIGATKAETNGTLTLFRCQNGEWIEHQVIRCPNETELFFGANVSIDGNLLVVGRVPHYDLDMKAHGSAYVYRLFDDKWILQQRLQTPEPYERKYSGNTVLVHGETIFFTSLGEYNTGGAVYVFESEKRETVVQQ